MKKVPKVSEIALLAAIFQVPGTASSNSYCPQLFITDFEQKKKTLQYELLAASSTRTCTWYLNKQVTRREDFILLWSEASRRSGSDIKLIRRIFQNDYVSWTWGLRPHNTCGSGYWCCLLHGSWRRTNNRFFSGSNVIRLVTWFNKNRSRPQ